MGIKHIKGKWFKWFSPDDILYPNAIETLVNKAKQLPENTILRLVIISSVDSKDDYSSAQIVRLLIALIFIVAGLIMLVYTWIADEGIYLFYGIGSIIIGFIL